MVITVPYATLKAPTNRKESRKKRDGSEPPEIDFVPPSYFDLRVGLEYQPEIPNGPPESNTIGSHHFI